MNMLPLATLALATLAATLPARPVAAASTVQRCQTAQGTWLYTDRACEALGATPAPMPTALEQRIAREAAHRWDGTDEAATTAIASPRNARSIVPAIVRRSLLAGCARSPTQLAMDVQGALLLQDVNRLAESYHWVGMTHARSRPVMDRLQRLSRENVVDVGYFDATMGMHGIGLADAGPAAAGPRGLMHVTVARDDTGETRTLDFDVVHYAGCYFMRP